MHEAREFFAHDSFDVVALVVGEVVVGVFVDHVVLNGVDKYGFEVAVGALLVASGADEVGVDAAGAASRFTDDQSASAVAAPQRPDQVVEVAALALTGQMMRSEYVLDALPGLVGDEPLVFAFVLDSQPDHDAAVVGVMEEAAELGSRERFTGPFGCRSGSEAAPFEALR